MQREGPKYIGEPSIEALASGLGTLGRYGDDYMVHAAEGETVVPAEILAANPGLKHQLFMQMRMMGITDPNRYVVGNALNSINPITGQPEFWFKKIWKSIKKVLKKVAPIIVPMIGNIIAPGIGGPIASALLTKVQGGNWGDALKSAAMAYGAQTLGAGIRGLSQGATGSGMEGFWTGLKKGALAPWDAASNIFSSGKLNPLAQGIFGPRGANLIFSEGAKGIAPYASTMDAIFPSYQSSPAMIGSPPTSPTANVNQGNQAATRAGGTNVWEQRALDAGAQPGVQADPRLIDQAGAGADDFSQTVSHRGVGPQMRSTTTGDGDWTYLEGGKDAATIDTGGKSWLEGTKVGDWLDRNPAVARIGEKVLSTTAGPLAVTGLTYYLASEDEDPEPSPEELAKMTDPQSYAWQQYNANRTRDDWTTWRTTDEARSLLAEAGIYGPQYELADIARITGVPQSEIDQSRIYGASGGIASLQGGGEIAGPGTGTSDSIPARLSDGEFVMTAESVRNAGKGDRNLGAARMYDLMQRFEGAPA